MYTAAQTRTHQDRLGRALISHQTPLSLGCDDITSNSQRPVRAVTSNCLSQNGYKAILQPRGKRICLRQGSAPVLKRKNAFDGGGLQLAAGALQMWEPKRMIFDTKNGTKTVPKVIEIVAKGNLNEPRNLERHPYGTVSKKYRKRMPKGSVRASSFGIIFNQNQSESQKENIKQINQKPATEQREK